MNIVKLIIALFIAVPLVHSFKYRISFDPERFFIPCKEFDPPQKYFDLSELVVRAEVDDTVKITGSIHRIEADTILTDAPVVAFTKAKQKTRGRWVDTPFSYLIKDFCEEYLNPKTKLYEHVTARLVADERICPPKINVKVPFNVTIDLIIESSTALPSGEYMSETVMKQGTTANLCFQNFVDLNQV